MNEPEPRRRPLRSPSFVGRERELAELMVGLDDIRAGRGRLFLVAGEPGIGKTRLVEEVALEAARSGALALWARCREWPGAPPFWPWIQALRDLVARASLERLARWLGPGASSLTQLLPELRGRFAEHEQPPVAADSEHGRFYLFDAVANCLRSAAAETPLVLVFDDLQAADVSSLRLLEFVARELRSARLLVLGTHREPEIAPPSVAESLALLARDGERLPLRGLSEPEVQRFVEAVAGEPLSPRLVHALHAETDGNPFFLDELVRVLAAEGKLGPAEGGALLGFPVPQGVRAAILRRIAPLTERSRELLALASVAGREFETVCLARAAELEEEALLEALHDAFAAGVLLRDAASFERLRFSHAQVREVLYDDIPPSRRSRLHRRIGEVIHDLHRGSLDAHAAELAHHFLESAAVDDGERGIEYAERAARHAGETFAYEEAIALYRGALAVLERRQTTEPRRRAALLLSLGEAQWRVGDREKAWSTFLDAAALARELGDPVLLAKSALGYGGEGSRLPWVPARGRQRSQAELLQSALEGLGDREPELRARCLARLATSYLFSSGRDRSVDLTAEAVSLAREAADPRTLAATLQARHMAISGPDFLAERLAIAEEIVRIAVAIGDPELALPGHRYRFLALLETGDVVAADREIESWARIANDLRQPLYLTNLAMLRALRAILDGRFAEGEDEARRALELSRRTPDLDGSQQSLTLLGPVRLHQGRVDELLTAIGTVVERSAAPIWRCYRIYLQAESGRAEEARRGLEALAADGFASLPRDGQWLLATSFLAHAAAALREPASGSVLYRLLLPYGRRIAVVTALSCWGAIALPLGLLAASLGRLADAERHFEDALELHQKLAARPLVALTLYAHARALVEGGTSAARTRVADLLGRARGLAEEVGMPRLVEAIYALRSGALPSPESRRHAVFHRRGEFWVVGDAATPIHLRDSKGLRSLACLLGSPGRDFHALELSALVFGASTSEEWIGRELDLARAAAASGGAGEILDQQARGAYRRRMEELREDLDEASRTQDLGRAARAERELELLARELAGAVGLGRRARRARVPAERARVNVTKTILQAIRRITTADPAFGGYLRRTVRTGTFVSYNPDAGEPLTIEL